MLGMAAGPGLLPGAVQQQFQRWAPWEKTRRGAPTSGAQLKLMPPLHCSGPFAPLGSDLFARLALADRSCVAACAFRLRCPARCHARGLGKVLSSAAALSVLAVPLLFLSL